MSDHKFSRSQELTLREFKRIQPEPLHEFNTTVNLGIFLKKLKIGDEFFIENCDEDLKMFIGRQINMLTNLGYTTEVLNNQIGFSIHKKRGYKSKRKKRVLNSIAKSHIENVSQSGVFSTQERIKSVVSDEETKQLIDSLHGTSVLAQKLISKEKAYFTVMMAAFVLYMISVVVLFMTLGV